MAKSVLDGTDLILSMGTNALGFSTGCKVSTSAETGERVTKEASGGKWKESYIKVLCLLTARMRCHRMTS